MDEKTIKEQYPGYNARREITITYLTSSQGPPVYVVEDDGKSKEFVDTSLEEVVKEYFFHTV